MPPLMHAATHACCHSCMPPLMHVNCQQHGMTRLRSKHAQVRTAQQARTQTQFSCAELRCCVCFVHAYHRFGVLMPPPPFLDRHTVVSEHHQLCVKTGAAMSQHCSPKSLHPVPALLNLAESDRALGWGKFLAITGHAGVEAEAQEAGALQEAAESKQKEQEELELRVFRMRKQVQERAEATSKAEEGVRSVCGVGARGGSKVWGNGDLW
eukprot:351900-Chlamydomonas_euryale.AAC.2